MALRPRTVASTGCYPFELAAWRVRKHIKNDRGDIRTRAANYHSRTPKYNSKYRNDQITKAIKWTDWLEYRFMTEKKLIFIWRKSY